MWFIGVKPDSQNSGVGKKLMEEIVAESERLKRPIYLETSTVKNIPWYKKFGLNVYNQLDFGYTLFLIKND
ncbi:GNAT family N-acetyltransferase [Dyadobacter sp. CY351]|uniref:GNAT family N-acetyltransferase n=1 Tax=Dyadobacter sp. CY351 TaxID=2909337 RepID=UPI0038D4C1A0